MPRIVRLLLMTLLLALMGFSGALADRKTTFALPKLERTAESAALGDGGAFLVGLNSLGVNPAGLGTPHMEVLTHYQDLPLETDVAQVGFATPLPAWKTTIGITYLALQSADFDRRNSLGDPIGQFEAQDQSIGIHLSRPLDYFFSRPLTLGISLKYLRSEIDSFEDSGYAIDVGARYGLTGWPLSLGVSVLNVGEGPTLLTEEAPLPTRLMVSGAYQAWRPLTVLASFSHGIEEEEQEFSVGVQFWVGNVLALRGRYGLVQGHQSEVFGFENLSAGLGLRFLGHHSLDYAFQPFDSDLRDAGEIGTHRITATLRFGP